MLLELFILLLILFAAINITISIVLMSWLNKMNVKTNILTARFMIFKYLAQYRELTFRETGKIGLLYYLWIISINLAAVSAIGAFLVA